jgi:uncharacterized LabA/DUF88 family protein
MSERVAVYVDGANAYFAQQEALNWWIDWPSFLDWVKEGRELVSARWYQAYRSTPEPEQERFLHHLTIIGFAVRRKILKSIYDRETGASSLKGNLDVELAIDALTECEQFDTILLVTGDSDFVPLVDALRARGKRVMVCATQQNVAVELRQSVGVNYLDLRDLRHRIESDKRTPERESERAMDLEVEAPQEERVYRPAMAEANGNVRTESSIGNERFEVTSILDPHPPTVPAEDIELPQEGEIVRCNVQAVKKYGVFLDLHESAKTLLHVKDMNRGYVADAGEHYRVGEEISVQIVGIDWARQPPEVRVSVVTPEMEY